MGVKEFGVCHDDRMIHDVLRLTSDTVVIAPALKMKVMAVLRFERPVDGLYSTMTRLINEDSASNVGSSTRGKSQMFQHGWAAFANKQVSLFSLKL